MQKKYMEKDRETKRCIERHKHNKNNETERKRETEKQRHIDRDTER
jgi:hypothetical protein